MIFNKKEFLEVLDSCFEPTVTVNQELWEDFMGTTRLERIAMDPKRWEDDRVEEFRQRLKLEFTAAMIDARDASIRAARASYEGPLPLDRLEELPCFNKEEKENDAQPEEDSRTWFQRIMQF